MGIQSIRFAHFSAACLSLGQHCCHWLSKQQDLGQKQLRSLECDCVSTTDCFDEIWHNFGGLWLRFASNGQIKYRSSGGP